MASSLPRLLRTAAWAAGAALLLLGVWARQHHSETYFENTSRSGPAEAHGPGLLGRRVPGAPAPTGEASAEAGEDWCAPETLEEMIEGEEPAIIAGRVLDTDGKPIYGVDIRIAFDDDGPVDPDWDDSGASTTEAGLFVLAGRSDRRFRLTAERIRWSEVDWRKGQPASDGQGVWVERVVVEDVQAGRRDVRIRMAALPDRETEWEARIRVIGPDGKDVPAWGYTECSNGSAWSSIEGKVEPEPGQPGVVSFTGPPPYGLIITAPATKEWAPLPFAPGFVYIDRARKEPHVVHLQRAGAIRGRVDLPAGEATAQVLVRYAVLTSGRAEDPERLTAAAKERGAFMWDRVGVEDDGSFVFDGLPPGRVRLIPVLAEATLEELPSDAGQTVTVGETAVRLRLPAHARIEGTIDWKAVEDAKELSFQVHVSRRQKGRPQVFWSKHISLREVRASGGRFETLALPTTEEFTVEVWATGQPRGDAAIEDALASRRISRVRPGGSPLFVLLALAPELRGHIERADASPAGAGVAVKAMRLAADALFVAAGLAGDEVDEFFTPPEPQVMPAPGDGPFEAVTDAQGAFRFIGLRPGRYVVWTAGAVVQRAVAGGDDVRLRLGSGQRITGRVRTEGGGLPPGFVVEARSVRPAGGVLASTVVRTDGYFSLQGLPEGQYGLSVYNAHDPAEVRMAFYRPVPSGTRRLAVRLEVGRWIKGVVRDERGLSPEGALLTVTSPWDLRRVRVARDGTFRVGGLVEASYSLKLVLPDGRMVEGASTAGDSLELRVR